jgi:hypothetical protein
MPEALDPGRVMSDLHFAEKRMMEEVRQPFKTGS